MTDDRFTPRPVARWYMAAAIASLLFMLFAVWGEVMTETADPATLPLDQRVMVESRPSWMVIAYAVAVWSGLAGAILLVLKRKLAQPLLLVSLAAAALTFLPYAAVPAIRDNITTNDIAVAIVVLAITWTIFWFARHSAHRGWLR
jgi:hypothetical protein